MFLVYFPKARLVCIKISYHLVASSFETSIHYFNFRDIHEIEEFDSWQVMSSTASNLDYLAILSDEELSWKKIDRTIGFVVNLRVVIDIYIYIYMLVFSLCFFFFCKGLTPVLIEIIIYIYDMCFKNKREFLITTMQRKWT